MAKRIRILAMVMMLLLGVVLVQAANIQFRRGHELAASPKNPRNVETRLSLGRGKILAADGTVLARSVQTPTGVYKYQRVYPTGSLMGQITGFDSPIYGKWGIEAQYNSSLVTHKQPANTISELLKPTTSTDSVALTIQPALQELARSQLAGRDGAVVAINPVSGAVLAMYGNPSYDPNPLVAQASIEERVAWNVFKTPNADGLSPLGGIPFQRSFPPGSTFKVITSTAAYAKNPALANNVYPSVNQITIPNTPLPLQNFGGGTCGGTVAQMLPPSCDTGFAQLGLDLGATTMWEQAVQFGFNSRPPLDLPGVATSVFPTPDKLKYNQPFLAYGAIGQGDVAATTLQNALVAAAIANGGIIQAPHLLREIRDQQGNLVQRYQPHTWRIATSPQVAATVAGLMRQVVTNGTATSVGFRPDNDVAAKTGTAQTSATNVNLKTDDWMIAFAPANRPVVAIAVLLPNQALSATGAEVAGPIMKCMIEGALALALHLPVSNTATTCPA